MGFITSVIIVGCIHLSFLVVFVAPKPCDAGDCSKNAEVFLTNQTTKAMYEGNSRNAPSAKDVHYERSSEKENTVEVKQARKSKGFMTTSTQMNEKMASRRPSHTKNERRTDYRRSHGDYDSYDPAPALVKPPFKLIPN